MTRIPKTTAQDATATHWPRSGSVQPSVIANDPRSQPRPPDEPPAARFDGIATTNVGSAPVRTGPSAKLVFDDRWGERVEGALRAGGQMIVSFDPARVQIRHTHNGNPAWGVNAFVKFHPTGEVVERPAVVFESIMGRPTNNAKPSDVVVDIPAGTTSVEVWFRNWTGADRPEERWDSDWGRNYTFDVQR